MRKHLTRSGATVSLDPADYILQGHKVKTMYVIERVVEYAENQDHPFTRTECWHACYGHYSVVSSTILSMKRAGLIILTNPGRSPQRLISVDKFRGWQESSAQDLASRARVTTAR